MTYEDLLREIDKWIVTNMYSKVIESPGLTWSPWRTTDLEKVIDDMVDSYASDTDLIPREVQALKSEVMQWAEAQLEMYDANPNAVEDQRVEYGITFDEDGPPEVTTDELSDSERDYAEFEEESRTRQEFLENNQGVLENAIASLLTQPFYGIEGEPSVGRRNIYGQGTMPIYGEGIEANLYADSMIGPGGSSALQEVQLLLLEVGLLGFQTGQMDLRQFTPNQLDASTTTAIQSAMALLNRNGEYLPSISQLLKDFEALGLDTSLLEAVNKATAGTQTSADASTSVAAAMQSLAQSKEGKELFHSYFITGLQKLAKDRKEAGAKATLIELPSQQALIANARAQWSSMTQSMMNPYLAAVAADEMAKIYEDVQKSEAAHMFSSSTADLYKQAQEARIKGEAVYTVESPYSDPQQMINDKVQNLLTSMAISDEKSMYEGAVNNSYGTNLWNILSSLG